MVTEIVLMLAAVAGPSSARENRKGLQAWAARDTVAALSHLAKAAKDTADARYSYNLGTVQALARKPGSDAAFDRALRSSRTREDSARVFYNRGTARLDAARSGQGDPGQSVQDLREALRRKPGWKDAARNLELALRMARPRSQGGGGGDDQKKDKNKDKGRDRQQPKQGQDEQKPPQPSPQSSGMSKEDAERMLDGAKAQEQRQFQRPARKEERDGPDW